MLEAMHYMNKLSNRLKNKQHTSDELRAYLRDKYIAFCRSYMLNNNSKTYREYRSACRVVFGVDLKIDRPVKARPVVRELQMELF